MAEGPSVADDLEKLAKLHDRGVLTDEEFEAQKARVLGRGVGDVVKNRSDALRPQVIPNNSYALGCPKCSTLFWMCGGDTRDLCSQCGSTTLWDAEATFWRHENHLKNQIQRVVESNRSLASGASERKRKSIERRSNKQTFRLTQSSLGSDIAHGPFRWYVSEQHNALLRVGRTLSFDEIHERIDALAAQQEAAHRNQREAAAALAFLSVSNQLRNIERNTR